MSAAHPHVLMQAFYSQRFSIRVTRTQNGIAQQRRERSRDRREHQGQIKPGKVTLDSRPKQLKS